MSYINTGAYVDNKRPRSKKALKDALNGAPGTVRFDSTALFGEQFNGSAGEIPDGVTLSVCGPDPYTARNWHANVIRKPDGTIKFS
jgi:hypothetical protein